MKQRITGEQLTELTAHQKDNLRKWWKPEAGEPFCAMGKNNEIFNIGAMPKGVVFVDNQGVYPLLSIGQMIELLDKKNPYYHISSPEREGDIDPQLTEHKDDEQWFEEHEILNPYHWVIERNSVGFLDCTTEDLCDTLWEMTKYCLINYI